MASIARIAAAKAAVLITAVTTVTYALTMITSALVARDLGPDTYGRYAYMVWLSGLLVVIANHGLGLSGIRFVAQSLGHGATALAAAIHSKLGRMQRWSLLGVLGVFVIAAAVYGSHLFPPEHVVLFTAVVVVAVAARASYLFTISIAKGYGAFNIEAMSTSVVAIGTLALTVTFWLLDSPITWYALLFAASGICTYLIASQMLRRRNLVAHRGEIDTHTQKEMNHHLLWSVVLLTAGHLGNKSVETFMLNIFAGPAAVGYFAIATALARGGVDLLTAGLTTVMMPSMGKAYGAGGRERVSAILADALRYFWFFGLLLGGIGWFWSGPIIRLMYGPDFEPAAFALSIVIVVGGVTLIESAVGSFMTTTGNQSVWAKAVIGALVVSATLSTLLIPKYGLAGALVSFTGSRLLLLGILTYRAVREYEATVPFGAMARTLGAAAIGFAAADAVNHVAGSIAGPLLAGGLFALCFPACTIPLKAWWQRDMQLLAALVKGQPKLAALLGPAITSWLNRYMV